MSDLSKVLVMFKERDLLKAIDNTLSVIGIDTEKMKVIDQIESIGDQLELSDEAKQDLKLRLMVPILKDKGKADD